MSQLLTRTTTAGDATPAVETLVREYSRTLWAITKQYRLSDADSADAVQTTWLRLLENLESIREPERIAGWLATTVRRICIESGRRARRWHPVRDPLERSAGTEPGRDEADEGCPERAALSAEHVVLVRLVLAELPDADRRLIHLLMASPPPTYREVSVRLGMPVGSIGPTRARILARLRVRLASLGLEDGVLG